RGLRARPGCEPRQDLPQALSRSGARPARRRLRGAAGRALSRARAEAVGMIALLLAAAAALPEATPLGLDVQVAPEEVTLGQHILVELSVEHDPRDVYSLPSFDPAPLAVPPGTPPPRVRRQELAKDRAKTIFTLTLTDYGTLEPKLPDFTLH